MNTKEIIIIFHGRFPSEKAAALFADESAQAFEAQGMQVTLLVPKRRGWQALQRSYKVEYLFTADFYRIPMLRNVAYRISYLIFSIAVRRWLRAHASRDALICSNEVLPFLLVPKRFVHTLFEVHDFPEQNLWMYRRLFRRVQWILATNDWKAKTLKERFDVPAEKIFVERNATDTQSFAPADKAAARHALNLPQDQKIALYTGHLYGWKGVDTLAQAAPLLPNVQIYLVGGTQKDIEAYTKKYGSIENLHLVGHKPHDEMPRWQAAADVLVLPNTSREELSAHYTSPLKLFEYMASERPIVASNLHSIAEIISQESAYLVEPDSAHALAQGIDEALSDPQASLKAQRARAWVLEHSWERRARRILERIGALE